MSHEIHNAMVARSRILHDRDESRYGTVRLTVQRQGLGKAVCSLIVTRVGGQRLQESRLAFATVDVPEGVAMPELATRLLEEALEALRRQA